MVLLYHFWQYRAYFSVRYCPKKPVNSGAVSVRSVSVRERFMRFLLGDKVRLTVIVPGSTVEELSIREVAEGGLAHE